MNEIKEKAGKEMQEVLEAMVLPLCSWYLQNKRKLPWRENRDPYRIWVSEIMLQQTRVEAALPYYERFLEAFPTVSDLAKAPHERLLKLWEGLGYYSRVKNMQKAAEVIEKDYGGAFPKDAKALRSLPGIGDYTAGAIASIAFGLPEPAVDGNVLRVLARLCNDDADIMQQATKRRMHEALQEVYPLAEDAGDLTQAIMELGALVCIPGGAPKCDVCPLREICRAHGLGRELQLPVKTGKKEKKIVKRTVFILSCGDKIALVKRPGTGVLANFYEFPAIESHASLKEAKEYLKEQGIYGEPETFTENRHVFTHLIWDMKSYFVKTKQEAETFLWVTLDALKKEIALPSAVKPFYLAVLKRFEGGFSENEM